MTTIIPHKFVLRDYQISAWEALLEGRKRLVLCWHRGAGKDLFAMNWMIFNALREPAVYLHCFPKYSQGKKAIWSSRHNTDDGDSLAYIDHIPKELIKYKNSTDMRIELINGSIYCVMGLDGNNAQNARGMNPTHVIMSEYAYMDPIGWRTIEPRVIQNNGTAIFLSTPNGKNHFYDLYNFANSLQNIGKPNSSVDIVVDSTIVTRDYFASRITNAETLLVDERRFREMRETGVPEDFIQQEWFCSFEQGAEGSYYGKLIQKARDDERICNLPIRPDVPCCTAWDIGVGDATAIWIFQQLPSGLINFIHYFEDQGQMLNYYLSYLDKWKNENKVLWDKHYAPHDMANREMTGERLEVARNMGYQMIVLKREGFDDGIQAARSLLSTCSFDEERCKRGIKCLDFYRKKYNEALKIYSDTPLHDQYSHGADAFRYAALGIKLHANSGKVDKNFTRDMYFKHGR